MINRFWPPWRLQIPGIIPRFDFYQAREEACVKSEGRSFSVIDMTVIYGIRQNDAGLIFPDRLNNNFLGLRGVLKKTICQLKVVANGDTQDTCGCLSLLLAR